jgi:DNA-binding response OmpR family regulator
MKILTVSTDKEIIRLIDAYASEHNHQSINYNASKRPIDIVGYIYEKNPFLIIVDDDFVKTDAAVTISTIKKMKENLKVIFITSDSSVQLGKKISPLGIAYYAIKPLNKIELDELLNSLSKTKLNSTY